MIKKTLAVCVLLTGVGVLGGEGKVRVGVRIRARFPAVFLVFTAIAVTVAVDGGRVRDRGRTSSPARSVRRHTPAADDLLALFVFLARDRHPFVDLHRRFPDCDPLLLPAPDAVHRKHKLFHIVLFAGPGFGPHAARHVGGRVGGNSKP